MQAHNYEMEFPAQFSDDPRMANRLDDTHSFEAIGRRLAQVRRALGMSQTQISEQMGLKTSRWNNWELGINQIPPVEVRKLKRMLPGLTSDWIYDGEDRALSVEVRERLAAFENATEEPVKRRGRPVTRQ